MRRGGNACRRGRTKPGPRRPGPAGSTGQPVDISRNDMEEAAMQNRTERAEERNAGKRGEDGQQALPNTCFFCDAPCEEGQEACRECRGAPPL